MTRKILASLLAVVTLLVVTSSGALATYRCDPGRVSSTQTTLAGSRADTTVGSNTRYDKVTGWMENDSVPFLEQGSAYTYLWIEMQDKQNLSAKFRLGFGWGSGQGLLSSTVVRVIVTNEAGTATLLDTGTTYQMNDFGGSDSLVKFEIYAPNPEASNETYFVYINDELLDLNPTYHWTFSNLGGAEDFEYVNIYGATANKGNEMLGAIEDHQDVVSLSYETQFGTGQLNPHISLDTNTAYGVHTDDPGAVHIWDPGC